MNFPLPLETDQYKANSHWNMVPSDVTATRSYCEARIGAKYNDIVFHGLQALLMKRFVGAPLTLDDIHYSDMVMNLSNFHSNPFNLESWIRLYHKHNGRIPVRIKALPEGTIISPGTAWFTIEGTDPEFAWLSQRLESVLLHTWYPTTIATRSRNNIKVIQDALIASSEQSPELARHLYVDFGYRACSCDEQAAIGGAAHGINSYASDTILGLVEIDRYYGGLTEKGIMYSVPATEHRIAQSFGKREDEYLLKMMELYPDWILSIVSDTNNIEVFVNEVVRRNKDKIIQRWEVGKAQINKVVIRPDSLRYRGDTPKDQVLWIFQKLEDIFGVFINKKGKKVLHPCIGVLWGDGISDAEIAELYKHISDSGYSVESLVVGQGGGLLVKDANRDTLRVALKASQEEKNGEWVDLIKDPLDSSKKSKTGNLKVIKTGTMYETINQHDPRFNEYEDQLITIFENGELKNFYTFDEIRQRAK